VESMVGMVEGKEERVDKMVAGIVEEMMEEMV